VNTHPVESARWTLGTPHERDTLELARAFGASLQAPLVIYLHGDLGAGKTTFARALIQYLGYAGRVKSPTYGLLETYSTGGMNTLHLDLYRIDDPGDVEELAIRDLFDERSLLLVEWPEKGGNFLPAPDVEIFFEDADGQRRATIAPCSPAGMRLAQLVRGQTTLSHF
jgi:tRNA threonylcarbamoyladenosine biosynthesis protein TsaE